MDPEHDRNFSTLSELVLRSLVEGFVSSCWLHFEEANDVYVEGEVAEVIKSSRSVSLTLEGL